MTLACSFPLSLVGIATEISHDRKSRSLLGSIFYAICFLRSQVIGLGEGCLSGIFLKFNPTPQHPQ